MATSGSIDFSMSRDDLIQDALLLITAIGNEESVSASDSSIVGRALNRLVKRFENQGLHMWKKTEATLFLQQDQESYVLSNSASSDHCTETFVQTTTTAAAALSATTLNVTSATGMTVGDNIGILLSSGTIQWTTITNIASLVLTINTGLTLAAASGSTIFTYTTKINKPLDIFSVRRRILSSNYDIRMSEMAYAEYQNMPNKVTAGPMPIQWTFNRNTSNVKLFVWPMPGVIDSILKITYAKPLEDFDAATDTPDFPQEYYNALLYQLAVDIAPIYGKTGTPAYNDLKTDALTYFVEALSFDNESTHIKLTPNLES